MDPQTTKTREEGRGEGGGRGTAEIMWVKEGERKREEAAFNRDSEVFQ